MPREPNTNFGRLSNQLVRVQEDERRTISRELHDEIGQILTGLRMELGSLSRGESDAGYRERLDSVKRLAEEALRSVRNLALLLRPSMLDDLGLEPALRWQAKEFSRRTGIPVSVDIQGNIDSLPEAVRICLYRAIQEALTNCSKHAEATRITVTVSQKKDLISASVEDNGRGFDARQRTSGLGLVGMEERVRALQGRFAISSVPGERTSVSLSLPLAPERTADGVNRANSWLFGGLLPFRWDGLPHDSGLDWNQPRGAKPPGSGRVKVRHANKSNHRLPGKGKI